MNDLAQPLSPVATETPMLAPHWQIRAVQDARGQSYQVIGTDGAVVASNIQTLEIARLFALSPLVFKNFQALRLEAERSLDQLVDSSFYDIEEVAEDASGHWEEECPGAPEFASWLLDLYELEDMVGPQADPPEGVTKQYKLFLD